MKFASQQIFENEYRFLTFLYVKKIDRLEAVNNSFLVLKCKGHQSPLSITSIGSLPVGGGRLVLRPITALSSHIF